MVFQLFPDVACQDKGPRFRVEGFVDVGRIQLDFLGLVSELLQDFPVVKQKQSSNRSAGRNWVRGAALGGLGFRV